MATEPADAIRPGPEERLADDRDLVLRKAEGDAAAREELIERYMPLVQRLAARYRHGKEPMEDLIQAGSVGLVKAVDRFDPDRGLPLASFAVPTILGELKRHFRDHGWAVHMPRELQERILKVERVADELATGLARSPSIAEIAARLELSEEDVLEAMAAAGAATPLSLDAKPPSPEEDGPTVAEKVGDVDPGYEVVEYGASIGEAVEELSERERLVMHLRFVEDQTQSQIAERIGVSQMHVSRIIRRTVDRLRSQSGEAV
jgi:RNA polymerase sigma-B factor